MIRTGRSGVWPVLHYEDTDRALEFLTGAIGFEAGTVVTGDSGQIVHAEVHWPEGGSVVFGLVGRGEGVHSGMKAGASASYVATTGVDAVYERAKGSGAEIVQPPAETVFGNDVPARAFTLRDPEGNLWTFGTYGAGTG